MKTLLTILMCSFLFVLNGQRVTAYLSKEIILTGEPDTLTLKVNSPSNLVVFPQFKDTLSENLELLGVGAIDTSVSDLGFSYVQQLYFTAFDTGFFVVPPVKVTCSDSAYESNPLLLTVQGVQVDLQQNIRDINDIEDAAVTLQEVLLIVGKVLLFLIVILLVIRLVRILYLKYRLSKESKEEEVEEVPFMDVFWEKLKGIEEQKYWQKGEVKKYHSQVTELMRLYLEHRYQIKAMEQTTAEILQQLKVVVSERILFEKIEQTLRFADMVKFAKAKGVQDQHEKAIDNLKELVSLTLVKDEQ